MPTNRYGDSGLFDPMPGDGYDAPTMLVFHVDLTYPVGYEGLQPDAGDIAMMLRGCLIAGGFGKPLVGAECKEQR